MPLMVSLTACPGEPIEPNAPPPPREYLVCESLPKAPNVEALSPFALSDGRVVYLASEVDRRDVKIATYIVDVRGAWFSCSNQLGRVRDYVDGVE